MKIAKINSDFVLVKSVDGEFHLIDTNAKFSFEDNLIEWKKTIHKTTVLLNEDMSIENDIFKYTLHLRNKKESNTLKAKLSDLKLFYEFMNHFNLSIRTLTTNDINDFIAWLMGDKETKFVLYKESKRQAKTVNRALSTIRSYYTYLNALKITTNNPFEFEYELINKPSTKPSSLLQHTNNGKVLRSIFKIKESESEMRILTIDGYKTILESMSNVRDKIIFRLLYYTGMRIGEVLSLKSSQIKTGGIRDRSVELWLEENEIDRQYDDRNLKTGSRLVYIPTKIYNELLEYKRTIRSKIYDKVEFDHPYLFINQGNNSLGSPLSYNGIKKRFINVSTRTGIKVSPHDLRHTFATNLAKQGHDIKKIQELLGHSNINSVMIYVKVAKRDEIAEDMQNYYESLESEMYE